MASSWGNSWASSWGDSWGAIVELQPQPAGGIPSDISKDTQRREEEEILLLTQVIMRLINNDLR